MVFRQTLNAFLMAKKSPEELQSPAVGHWAQAADVSCPF